MLPLELKHESKIYKGDDDWKSYLKSIGKFKDLDNEFLSQICYEHYERFNNYFPRFDITKNKISRIKLTTQQVYDYVKYDRNTELDFWYDHIDSDVERDRLKNYPILNSVLKKGTWQLPPVIIKNKLANELGDFEYGNPIHLIEGTHRVSYLRRWFEKENIDKNKEHIFLLIE